MRGKKPKERQRYVLRVNETLIEVTRDVYLAWYQSRRKERYQLEKMQKKESSLRKYFIVFRRWNGKSRKLSCRQ